MIHIENNSFSISPVELVIDTGIEKLSLLIYPDSDPIALARHLCYKNSFQYKLIPTIADKIRQMKYQHFEEQEEEQTPVINRKNQYLRSYEEKENRSGNHVSSYMRESRGSQGNVMNRGELLYERNLRLEEMKKKHLESLQEEINDRKQKDLTFEPKINKLSSIIADRLSSHNISVNERNQRKRAHKSVIYQAEKQKSLMQQCTFKPKINRYQNNNQVNRYQSLYEDNNHRQFKINQKQKIKQSLHNFKPEINKISHVLVGSICFQQRLNRDIENRQNRKYRREEQERSRSKHKPMTGRPPALRNIQNLPVGDYLYNKSKKLRYSTPTQKLSHVDSKSEKIYQIKKLTIFQTIFDFLDINENGYISWQNDYSDILCSELWELIYPVMEEMTDMKVNLNKEEFVNSLEELWKSYSLLERNRMLRIFKTYGDQKKEVERDNNKENISKSVSINQNSYYNHQKLKQTKLKQAVSKPKIKAFR